MRKVNLNSDVRSIEVVSVEFSDNFIDLGFAGVGTDVHEAVVLDYVCLQDGSVLLKN